jgi:aminoglycoside phosphotransferase (APT) family kinase protein
MELDPLAVGAYLSRRFAAPVEVLRLAPLGDADATDAPTAAERLKTQGYGLPVLVQYRLHGREERAVLRTMAPNPFGHERRADRAAGMILSYDSFNDLPRHVHALDVGVLAPDGGLATIGPGEIFLLTDYAPGNLYADDLRRIAAMGIVTDLDLERAHALAAYLATIHATRQSDPVLYRRHLRDVFGSGEGIVGLIDSYPPDYPLADAAWLERVETRLVAWRARLKRHPERLAQIHGDFHPFNVLFADGVDFALLDRSRGPWGEPADDVAAMAINYLFFGLQQPPYQLAAPFVRLWTTFWQTYLDHSGDQALLQAVQPFFVWRALVVASPVWYQVADPVRRQLFQFIDHTLNVAVFDPAAITDYLQPVRRAES